ncbi:hypothetical protein DL96DRAFT_1410284, partial [Flagelloscypha sp. PMI_526]
TVFNGEEVGALLGLHLLEKEIDLDGKNVSIFIDSQALVQAMETRKTKSGQWYLEKITQRLRRWLKQHQTSKVAVHWISAHSGVELNELVDEAAKEAAQGESSERGKLPKELRGELPWAAAALKQTHEKKLNQEW